MLREIGSDYWIDRKSIKIDKAKAFKEEPETIYLSTCRSAMKLLIKDISLMTDNRIAMVPGFTCHTVIEPFVDNGYEVYPYPVQRDLSIDIGELEKLVVKHQPSIFLYHSYFGFQSDNHSAIGKLEQVLHSAGCTLVEDKTLCVFSSNRTCATYTVGSYRKWLAMPDGAFVKGIQCNNELSEDGDLTEKKLLAFDLKARFMTGYNISKKLFRESFAMAEEALDSRNQPYSISSISKAIYQDTNIHDLERKRRENYNYLYKHLRKYNFVQYPINHCTYADEIPYMFPLIVTEHRKELQNYLAGNDIYATIIWACSPDIIDKITDETKSIYDSILCIPCDQRYGLDDMERICNIYNDFISVVLGNIE